MDSPRPGQAEFTKAAADFGLRLATQLESRGYTATHHGFQIMSATVLPAGMNGSTCSL